MDKKSLKYNIFYKSIVAILSFARALLFLFWFNFFIQSLVYTGRGKSFSDNLKVSAGFNIPLLGIIAYLLIIITVLIIIFMVNGLRNETLRKSEKITFWFAILSSIVATITFTLSIYLDLKDQEKE